MISKKGLSTVVTTLIIVLLVLAAIGIIWSPIKNLLTQSSESFDQTKCLEIDIKATKIDNINNVDNGTYAVTLTRAPTGEGSAGAKLIFFDANGLASGVEEFGTQTLLEPLEVITEIIDTEDLLTGAVKVQVTPYYLDDDSGEQKLCSSSTEFEFSLD